MKLPILAIASALSFALIALERPMNEVTVYPFQVDPSPSDLVIEEYVPLDSPVRPKRHAFKSPNLSKRTVWRVPGESNAVYNAWLDLNGNGEWDVGEPFGTSAGRDYPEIELTYFDPIIPRIDLLKDTSDRGLTIAEVLTNVLENAYDRPSAERWIKNNRITVASLKRGERERIRVVRWLVNGVTMYRAGAIARVVLDEMINTDVRTSLTEADVLVGNDGAFDLDWEYLRSELATKTSVLSACGNVTNVSYLVVIGDGPVGWASNTDSNTVVSAINTVVSRYFLPDVKDSGDYHFKPHLLLHPEVRGNRVTLKWRSQTPDIEGFTAYRALIHPYGSTNVIHDTGVVRAPARQFDGTLYWTITNSLAPGRYDWELAPLDSKFTVGTYTNGIPFTVGD